MIAVRKCGAIHFHHVGIDLLLVGVETIPGRDARRALGEFGIRRDETRRFLPREGFFAHLVPALIELSFELCDPILWCVMRRVGCARCIIREERFIGRGGVLHPQPVDRAVRQVLVEEVVLCIVRRFDGLSALRDRRIPLTGITTDEAVEVFKTQPGRPQVERTRSARLPVGDVVILAVPRSVVTVLFKDLGKRPRALWHQRVVTRETGTRFHDDTSGDAVVVPST